jgi:UDP-N-acetylmuramoyl-L-alanyl-D-glutamate--2,6-diaminopimelate ligase
MIVVFGCAGLRDEQKRPMMGEIGARLADKAVFTSEDPRTENIWSILRQMKDGVISNHNRIVSIPDREAAIRFAIKHLARKGDCVVVCGKGHERSMCYGTEEISWHDPTVVLSILKERR